MACHGPRARGGESGVAQRGAGGTRRATRGKKQVNLRDRAAQGGGGSRGQTTAQRYTMSRAEKRHADEPH